MITTLLDMIGGSLHRQRSTVANVKQHGWPIRGGRSDEEDAPPVIGKRTEHNVARKTHGLARQRGRSVAALHLPFHLLKPVHFAHPSEARVETRSLWPMSSQRPQPPTGHSPCCSSLLQTAGQTLIFPVQAAPDPSAPLSLWRRGNSRARQTQGFGAPTSPFPAADYPYP